MCSKQGRAASDDHALTLLGTRAQQLAHVIDHPVAVEGVGVRPRQPFERTMPEGLAKAVVPGVEAFIALRDEMLLHSGPASNLFEQAVVDQLPSQPAGKVVGISRALAAVLPLDRNHSDHDFAPFQSLTHRKLFASPS